MRPYAIASESARGMVQDRPGLVQRHTRKPLDELMDGDVVFEVSKRAATGTRVPRKAQAPLTRAGSRSTAMHDD